MMQARASLRVARTDVRLGTLARHEVRVLADGAVYAVATGLGLPRTWSLACQAALDGFAAGLGQGLDATNGVERLRSGVASARSALARRCDDLVERMLPDASLIAVLLGDGQLHVLSVGPGRVYIQRSGRPQRLTSRDEAPGGLLRAQPSQCSAPVRSGDLVLAGSLTAFSMSAIAEAVVLLSQDRMVEPKELARLLTAPAAKAGVGAAAMVLRIG